MRVTHNIQYSCTKWIYEDRHCYSLFIALQIFMIPNFCYIMSKFSVQLRTFTKIIVILQNSQVLP